jgi:hypothetical protein
VAVVFAFLLAIGVSGGATAFASQDALPNDTLYPVKLFTEDVQVWLTFDDSSKADRLLDQSDERMDEIGALLSNGDRIPENVLATLQNRNERAFSILEDHPEESVLWARALAQADSQERILVDLWSVVEDHARVEYAEAVADVHNLQLPGEGAAVLESRPEDLQGGITEISGTVEVGEDGSWTVGNYKITVGSLSAGSQGVASGSTVKVKFARGLGSQFYALTASVIAAGAPPSPAIVSGQIEEVTADAVKLNGQWYQFSSEILKKTPLRKGQTVTLTVDTTEGGPQVSAAEAAPAARGSFKLWFEGAIEGDASSDAEEWTVGGKTFVLTSSRHLDFAGGSAAEGARALVEAAFDGDGAQLTATKITILKAEPSADRVYLVGEFEGAAQGGLWYVSGIELAPRGGAQAPETGSLIAVEADADDGDLSVRQFTVIQGPDADTSMYSGIVSAIDNTAWTTPTGDFRVASRTSTVWGKELEGARAIIWHRTGTDGSREAVFVRVLDEEPVVQPAEGAPEEGQ